MPLSQTSWFEMFSLAAVLPCCLLATLLLFRKFPVSRALGLLVLSGLLALAPAFVTPEIHPQVQLVFVLTYVALLHRYAISFFSNTTPTLLPLLPVPLVGMLLFFLPGSLSFAASHVLVPLVLAGHLIIIWRHIARESGTRGMSLWLTPGARLKWFRNFFFANAVIIFPWLLASLQVLPAAIIPLGMVLICSYIIFQAFQESDFLSPIPLGNKYQKSTLTAAQKASILDKLDVLIREEKFYLDTDITLSGLAGKLQTTTHHLSQVLNESRRESFQELLTYYRIREARQLLKDPEHQNTKIEHIATLAGYNSKSAFNTAFKKLTGLTPNEFKTTKGVLTDRDEHLSDREETYSNANVIDSGHRFTSNAFSMVVVHFFKVFLRQSQRNLSFSLINLLGLTVGFCCALVIYLIIHQHSGYDTTLPGSSQVYRIGWFNENPQTKTPHPMAQALVNDFPEVEAATSLTPFDRSGLNGQTVRVENPDKGMLFPELGFFFVDSTFLDVFQLKVIHGDSEALKKPFNLVISASLADKYFGEQNPIGQELIVDDWPIEIAAVIEDMPDKSHFHFSGLISYVTTKTINPGSELYSWKDFGHFNYLKLADGAEPRVVEAKIPKWAISYLSWGPTNNERLLNGETAFRLQPVNDIHLHSHLKWELEDNGNILYIYILAGAMAFILLIACVNYINLTTARSVERSREIGIRKTLGAVSSSLGFHFYLESLIFCVTSFLLACLLSALLLPLFRQLIRLPLDAHVLLQPHTLWKAGLVVLAISLLAGLYPALALSHFRPAEVLKGKMPASLHGKQLRNGLVVFQFFVSSILIVASLIILKQLHFMKTKELGFDQEAVISLRVYESVEVGGIDVEKVRVLESALLNIPGVKATSALSHLPGGRYDQATAFATNHPAETIDAAIFATDYEGLEVLNIPIIDGRTFTREFAGDSLGTNFIINQQLARKLKLKAPVGEPISWTQDGRRYEGTIIGVAKDFHFESLHKPIEPLLINLDVYGINQLVVKMEGNQFQKTLTDIQKVYQEVHPGLPFEYRFLDEQIEAQYNSEVRTLNIFSAFTVIALMLACVGLFGLAVALLHQQIKEVGIRKILGAYSTDIFSMFLGRFVKLIALALLLGLPTGYWLMQYWISEFSYQTAVGIFPFVMATLALMIVAVLSVAMIIVKIANVNPAEILRHE